MEWVPETDLETYGGRVLPWLARDPVRTTVPGSILTQRLDGSVSTPDLWMAWLAAEDGAVAGIALRTPPRGLLVSPLPPGAARSLAAVAEPALPGAAGPT